MGCMLYIFTVGMAIYNKLKSQYPGIYFPRNSLSLMELQYYWKGIIDIASIVTVVVQVKCHGIIVWY